MNSNYQRLYVDMVTLREGLKLLHFQTHNYGVHKTVDDFLERYDDLFDRFWETAQRDKFRLNLNSARVELNNIRSYEELSPLLEEVSQGLATISDRSLSNVCDEMAEAIAQFGYLMSFQ